MRRMIKRIQFIFLCSLCLWVFGAAVNISSAKDNAGGSAITSISLNQLPPEAIKTLALIRQGGPYPYAKDGVVFGNREKRLPKQARGYYTEYTVKTPGARNRGAIRIVAGGNPQSAGEFYYSDDHYDTFKRIKE